MLIDFVRSIGQPLFNYISFLPTPWRPALVTAVTLVVVYIGSKIILYFYLYFEFRATTFIRFLRATKFVPPYFVVAYFLGDIACIILRRAAFILKATLLIILLSTLVLLIPQFVPQIPVEIRSVLEYIDTWWTTVEAWFLYRG
jgi:hypothetical protein